MSHRRQGVEQNRKSRTVANTSRVHQRKEQNQTLIMRMGSVNAVTNGHMKHAQQSLLIDVLAWEANQTRNKSTAKLVANNSGPLARNQSRLQNKLRVLGHAINASASFLKMILGCTRERRVQLKSARAAYNKARHAPVSHPVSPSMGHSWPSYRRRWSPCRRPGPRVAIDGACMAPVLLSMVHP